MIVYKCKITWHCSIVTLHDLTVRCQRIVMWFRQSGDDGLGSELATHLTILPQPY